MPYNPDRHHRRSMRLRGYDYTRPGAYFVTACVEGRRCLFGHVDEGRFIANAAGAMVADWWGRLPSKYPTVALDAFVVMPNHIHGIILLGAGAAGGDAVGGEGDVGGDAVGGEGDVGGDAVGGEGDVGGDAVGADPRVRPQRPPALGAVLQWLKTMTTNAYIRGVRDAAWPPFDRRLWQRNYYDHIVRNQSALERIRSYIVGNPGMWWRDRFLLPGLEDTA